MPPPWKRAHIHHPPRPPYHPRHSNPLNVSPPVVTSPLLRDGSSHVGAVTIPTNSQTTERHTSRRPTTWASTKVPEASTLRGPFQLRTRSLITVPVSSQCGQLGLRLAFVRLSLLVARRMCQRDTDFVFKSLSSSQHHLDLPLPISRLQLYFLTVIAELRGSCLGPSYLNQSPRALSL